MRFKCFKNCKQTYRNNEKRNFFFASNFFCQTVKPFLTSKGFLHKEDIALHIGDKTAIDCNELAKVFNEYYINIVQNATVKAIIKVTLMQI